MSIELMMEEIRALPVSERKKLIRLIVDSLPDDGEHQQTRTRSITELRGLGKEIWEGIDAKEYVNQLRDEWSHRP